MLPTLLCVSSLPTSASSLLPLPAPLGHRVLAHAPCRLATKQEATMEDGGFAK
jgi:hypothetical protein